MNKNWTGERLETYIFNENTLEHLHRYAIATQLAKGKHVMDIACGEGYGSNLLAQVAAQVTGVDISRETVEAAKKKYRRSNLNFLEGSAAKIPFADNSLDMVVSFETIEHHDEHEEMMQEIKRVLKPGGILIISTPDKANYTDKRKFINEHHVKELYEDEFRSLISRYFQHADYYYQRTEFCSAIVPEKKNGTFTMYKGSYEAVDTSATLDPLYIICIASNDEVKVEGISIFSNPGIYQSMIKQVIDNIRGSASYKLGNIMLKPVHLLRKMFGRS